MPATSKAQRRLMGLAEHHPEQVSPKNRSVLKMSRSQLHDFAVTKEKKLPAKVKKSAKGSGPFSISQLAQGFKPPSSMAKIPGFKGGVARTPAFNTPGLTGRLRPKAAFSNPQIGALGSPGSRMGSGPMERSSMRQGYKHMGACRDYESTQTTRGRS